MNTSRMTVKGQVTVPKEYRDAFGWKAGDPLAFVPEKDGVKIVGSGRRRKGKQVVERLRRAPWNRRLSTDRLIAMTRGEE